MILSATEFHRSSNGDCWTLVHTADPVNTVVRHKANLPSGGHTTDVTVGDFLNTDGPGPEYAALRQLLEINEKGSEDNP